MSRKQVKAAPPAAPQDPNCRHTGANAAGPCPCERSCSCRARNKGPCPLGARVYWITRDSDLDGKLEDYCDVWTCRPTRITLYAGAYWLRGEWDMDGHYGKYKLSVILKWIHVLPESDRESIRFGPEESNVAAARS